MTKLSQPTNGFQQEVNAAREALSALKPQSGVAPGGPPSSAGLTPNTIAQNQVQPSPTTPQAPAEKLALAEPIGMNNESFYDNALTTSKTAVKSFFHVFSRQRRTGQKLLLCFSKKVSCSHVQISFRFF